MTAHTARDDEYAALIDSARSLDRLICRVAASGVEHDDERLGYVTVQIDREVWNRLREVVRHPLQVLGPNDG